MPSDSDEDENKRTGFLTDNDEDWLEGGDGGSDQKLALRIAIAEVMDDINYLFEQDLENISKPSTESLSELFTHVDSNKDLNREQCAKNLVALAYIITNEPIDYTKVAEDIVLHPRDDVKSPYESDRARGSAMSPSQPVGDLLKFRRALTDGIKLGKSRIERDNKETVPNKVVIDANTRLYKEPTRERLKPDSGVLDPDVSGFDTEDWRDATAKWVDAEYRGSDSSNVSQTTAMEMMINEIYANVLYRLSRRRNISDESITPNRLPDY